MSQPSFFERICPGPVISGYDRVLSESDGDIDDYEDEIHFEVRESEIIDMSNSEENDNLLKRTRLKKKNGIISKDVIRGDRSDYESDIQEDYLTMYSTKNIGHHFWTSLTTYCLS
jgi:hypothetical protein